MTNWEERYQLGETPWDKGQAHPGLVEFLRRSPVRGRVFVPGCGLGYDVRALAATADEVVGLDVAPSAVRAAKAQEAVGGERYVAGDLFALPKKLTGAFDWVFEHTCFCAIPPERRADYVEAVASALDAGGHLLGVFFLNPEMEPEESGPPFGTSMAELDDLFGGRFTVAAEWVPSATYEGREHRELMRVLALRD